jgi:hypothetical protein
VLKHPLDGVVVLMGGVGVLGQPELRAERKKGGHSGDGCAL